MSPNPLLSAVPLVTSLRQSKEIGCIHLQAPQPPKLASLTYTSKTPSPQHKRQAPPTTYTSSSPLPTSNLTGAKDEPTHQQVSAINSVKFAFLLLAIGRIVCRVSPATLHVERLLLKLHVSLTGGDLITWHRSSRAKNEDLMRLVACKLAT